MAASDVGGVSAYTEWSTRAMLLGAWAGDYEAAFVGDDDQLRPVPRVEFHHHAGHVRLGGRWADEQMLRDLDVGEALHDEREDLVFALRECVELSGVRSADLRARRELIDEASRHARCEQRVAAGNDTDGLCKLRGVRVLQQKATGPHAERLVDVLVGVEGGQYEYARRGVGATLLEDAASGLQPVHHGHADVHEHHIRSELAGFQDGLLAVFGLANH